MNKKLQSVLNEHNHMIRSSEAEKAGVSRKALSIDVKKGAIERIGHGLYASPDAMDDEIFRIQTRCSIGVFSHDTAIYFHDLSDRPPLSYALTVPSHYNAGHLRGESLQLFYIKSELHGLGKIEGNTNFGHPVYFYNAERALCDVIRSRSKMDMAIVLDAMKRYVRQKERNIPLLLEYSEAFRVKKLIQGYLEVLL